MTASAQVIAERAVSAEEQAAIDRAVRLDALLVQPGWDDIIEIVRDGIREHVRQLMKDAPVNPVDEIRAEMRAMHRFMRVVYAHATLYPADENAAAETPPRQPPDLLVGSKEQT